MEREIEFPLKGFTHSPVTNMSARKLNNRDAILMLMAANGPTVRTRTLKILMRGWRPAFSETIKLYGSERRAPRRFELHFDSYFNGYYGHVGTSPEGRKYRPSYGGTSNRAPCWWWANKRGEVQITTLGHVRLQQLKHDLAQAGLYIPELDNCLNAEAQ